MHQIKIFKGLESDMASLEQQINSWLSQSEIKVLNIFGNLSPQGAPVNDRQGALGKGTFVPSDILVIVHYEKRSA